MKANRSLRCAATLVTLLLLLTGCLGLRCDAQCSLRGVHGQRGQAPAAMEHCAGMAGMAAHDGLHVGAAKSCVPVTVAPLPQLLELGQALLPPQFTGVRFAGEPRERVWLARGSTTARQLQIPPLLQAGSLRV